MRLLDKSAINTQKADEQVREAKEGAKLAKKVDALRQLAATEQANLEKFRDASLEVIKEQVGNAQKVLDNLLEQGRVAEKRLEALRTPLDVEWSLVREKRVEIEFSLIALEKEKKSLQSAATLNSYRERDGILELERAQEANTRSQQKLFEAEQTLSRAKDELAHTRNYAEQILTEAKQREQSTIEREVQVAARERDAGNNEVFLRSIERDQGKRERLLKDRYETLERNIKRHGLKR